MSRSITVVNSSNWEHEDVVVRRADGQYKKRLRPTQQWQIPLFTGHGSVLLEVTVPENEQVPAPFVDQDGNQLVPEVSSTLVKARKRD